MAMLKRFFLIFVIVTLGALVMLTCSGDDDDDDDNNNNNDDPPIVWYDFEAQAPWYVCPQDYEVPPEATVVTAFDQAYHYFGAENRRDIYEEVDFPTEGSWSQVGLWLQLECPESGLCDFWDRTASVQLVLNPAAAKEDWEYLELTRHITPYRIQMCEFIDVTGLSSLLKGRQTLYSWIDTWVGPGHSSGEGWRLTVRFIFYPGPSGAADEVINIWGRRDVIVGETDGENSIDAQIDPFLVTIPADAKSVKARMITTGHAYDNFLNCAEFCQMRQDLYVNGELVSFNPWRDDCEFNPHSPQSGTWKYDRNGWCPGSIVVGRLLDLSALISVGSENEIDFDIRLASGAEYINTNPGDWLPFETISLQLYIYK